MNINSYVMRSTAIVTLMVFLGELAAPTMLYAITSGPAQPDFSSFEPVATTGMVNEFTGGFTYNLPVIDIPGPDGGYSMSLSYHSGVTPEEDATWVGYGWTLNPGAVNRSVRGFPDDLKDYTVNYINKQPDNQTFSIGGDLATEAFSIDVFKFNAGYSKSIRYNTYTGFSAMEGLSVDVNGAVSLGMEADGSNGSFPIDIRPSALLNLGAAYMQSAAEEKIKSNPNDEELVKGAISQINTAETMRSIAPFISSYGLHNFAVPSLATNLSKFRGKSYSVSARTKLTFIPFIPGEVSVLAGLEGNYAVQTTENENRKAYGFMYIGESANKTTAQTTDHILDYSTEKDLPFERKERFLSIPYLSYDMFNLSGEGLGGGFRLHNRKTGTLRPAYKVNTTNLYDVDLRIGIGTAFGGGSSISAGKQESSMKDWSSTSHRWATASDTTEAWYDGEPYYFSFSNDLGGVERRSSSDEPYRASISRFSQPVVATAGIDTITNGGERTGRSSNIDYSTNLEMYQRSTSHMLGRSYTPKPDIGLHVNRNEAAIRNQIGEFAIHNESGVRYVYGLPVYTRNERNMQFGVTKEHWFGNKKIINTNRKLTYEDDAESVVGEKRTQPYATTYLLTLITSPEYIDRTGDGPSKDDFGSYTKFNYRAVAPSTSKASPTSPWYKWRMPHSGMYYHPGKHLDNNLQENKDDRASVSSGEREIYYLESIETKTHVAYFVTNKTTKIITTSLGTKLLSGSGKERLDAYEAYRTGIGEKEDELYSATRMEQLQTGYDGVWQSAFAGKTFNGQTFTPSSVAAKPNKVQYLERIEMWSRDTSGKPSQLVKSVHFEYDYSVMAAGIGRWISLDSSDGVLPWDSVYNYGYPSRLNSAVGLDTRGLFDVDSAANKVGMYRHGKLTLRRLWFEYGGAVSARLAPYQFDYRYPTMDSTNYDAEVRSRYGSILSYGVDNSLPDALGLYHGKENPVYDEVYIDRWGNYQAKGGEWTSKYRPWVPQMSDGGFDPAAWHLKSVTLPSGGRLLVQYEQHDYRYVQNRPAMAMVPILDEEILAGDDVVRYRLNTDMIGLTTVDEKQLLVDAINELADKEKFLFHYLYLFKDCELPDLREFPTNVPVDYVTGYADVERAEFVGTEVAIRFKSDRPPHDLAVDYGRANRIKDYDCDGNNRFRTGDFESIDFWFGFLGELLPFKQIWDATVAAPNPLPVINYSYVRVPAPIRKLGGGVRVKRLLMYDKGMEANDGVLYGNEYHYVQQNTIGGKTVITSSGVATNEPYAGREENSLVTLLARKDDRNFFERLVSGRDKEQYDGPLGESAMPGASIGYAQVIVESIHKGATNTGHTVNRFWTARDKPFIEKHTQIETLQETPNPVIDFMDVVTTTRYWAAQGYSFILNNMHGQKRLISKRAGVWDPTFAVEGPIVEEMAYEYFEPGESIPILKNGVTKGVTFEPLGREEDIAMEGRAVDDIYENHRLSFDAGINIPSLLLFIPTPFFTASYKFTGSFKNLRQHSISKVISYPAVLKKITAQRSGTVVTTEYIAFSAETGRPVATMSYDGYDKLALQQSSPHDGTIITTDITAATRYPEMGQKYVNTRFVYDTLTYTKSSKAFAVPAGIADMFYEGDLVRLTHIGPDTLFGVGHIWFLNAGNAILQPVSYSKLFATSGTSTIPVKVEVLSSGRQNMLTQSAGHISQYGISKTAYQAEDSIYKHATNILSASATVYRESFTYDTAYYGRVYWGVQAPGQYEYGIWGRYWPETQYVYRDSTVKAVQGTSRAYTGGKVASAWAPFPFVSGSINSKWMITRDVWKMDPHGSTLEEQDALGVFSAVRYAHKEIMPSIVAKNARHLGIAFYSFEDRLGNETIIRHTGTSSYKSTDTTTWKNLDTITVDALHRQYGLSLRYWQKASDSIGLAVEIGATSLTSVFIAQSGDWKLFECRMGPLSSSLNTKLRVRFRSRTSGSTYVDDFRLHPQSCVSTCYVYDINTLRLVAQFDASHFATIYQYNGEGKLIRLVKETERGIKTVKDASYHVPLIARYTDTVTTPQHRFAMRLPEYGVNDVIGSATRRVKAMRPPQSPSGMQGNFDMLDIKLSPEDRKVKVLGSHPDSIRRGLNRIANTNSGKE